ARGRVAHLARLRLYQLDQLLHAVRRERRVRHQNERPRGDVDDGREIAHRVVRQLRIQVRRDGDRRIRGEEQGVAVGGRLGDVIGAYGAARAGAVLDHDRL